MKSNFYKKFEMLCLEHGLSIRAALIAMGLSTATYTNWKKGTMPNASTQKKIAAYFNISINELMDVEDVGDKPILSDESVAVIKAYSKIKNDEDRAFVMKIMDLLSKG